MKLEKIEYSTSELKNFYFDVNNPEQMSCFEAIANRHNVFMTGEGGAGKSYFTKRLYEFLYAKGINVAILTTTGIAATNFTNDAIPASTLHSYLKLGVNSKDRRFDSEELKWLRDLEIVIVDEVSMMSSFLLDRVHSKLKSPEGLFGSSDTQMLRSRFPIWDEKDFKQFAKSFCGEKQMIFVGDMFQLPPVVKTRASKNVKDGFIELTKRSFEEMRYNSELWFDAHSLGFGNLNKFKVFNFVKNYRQKTDLEYAKVINRLRVDKHTNSDLEYLNKRFIGNRWSDNKINQALVKGKVVYLASVNRVVNARNDMCLDILRKENPECNNPLTYDDWKCDKSKRQKKWIGKQIKFREQNGPNPDKDWYWTVETIENVIGDTFSVEVANDIPIEEFLTKEHLVNQFHISKARYTDKWKEDKCDEVTNRWLELVKGLKVMTLINKKKDGYMNGTITFISHIETYKDGALKKVFIKNNNGDSVEIEKHVWSQMTIAEAKAFQTWLDTKGSIVVDGKKQSSISQKDINIWVKQNVERWFEQYPLKIAFALTIHKSQGLTFIDGAFIDPNCWLNGQLYVALSRVTEYAKLHLSKEINKSFIKTDNRVIRFSETNNIL